MLAYDGVGGDRDPTGPAGRGTKFSVGVSFGAVDIDSSKMANEEEYALAVQMDKTFGKPATMDDHSRLIQSGKKLYGTTPAKSDSKTNCSTRKCTLVEDPELGWRRQAGDAK